MVSLEIPENQIEEFCLRWKIVELALFGSVLRQEEFRSDSDVDVLVTFAPDAQWSLMDKVRMKDELKEIFGREVDLVSKSAIRNPFRRYEILRTAQVVYAATGT